MKSPRSRPREERLGALVPALLVPALPAIPATPLPGRPRAGLVPPGRAGSSSHELRVPAGPSAPGHLPLRAPATLEAIGRGYEGRIVRIPPRPGRGPQARVPGRSPGP